MLDINVRDSFVAPAGKLLLSADYSQIELRLLAHVRWACRAQHSAALLKYGRTAALPVYLLVWSFHVCDKCVRIAYDWLSPVLLLPACSEDRLLRQILSQSTCDVFNLIAAALQQAGGGRESWLSGAGAGAANGGWQWRPPVSVLMQLCLRHNAPTLSRAGSVFPHQLCACVCSTDTYLPPAMRGALFCPAVVPQVSPEAREQAKRVVYGIVYGQTAFGLAQQLADQGVGTAAAQAMIDGFLARFPGERVTQRGRAGLTVG